MIYRLLAHNLLTISFYLHPRLCTRRAILTLLPTNQFTKFNNLNRIHRNLLKRKEN